MIQTFISWRDKITFEKEYAICWQSKRIGILYHSKESEEEFWETLASMRENVLDSKGQFVSLDLAELQTESLPEMFYTALKNVRWDHSMQFSLPIILQHNPRIALPFINRAILWQRLCDLLIVDDEPNRKTVLVLENINQASPIAQHEIARLIRFHVTYSIHRTFIVTLDRHSQHQLIQELQDILTIH